MKLGVHRSTSFDVVGKEPEFFRGLPSVDGGSLKAQCAVATLRWSAQIGRLPSAISESQQPCVSVKHYTQSAPFNLVAWTYHFSFDEPAEPSEVTVEG